LLTTNQLNASANVAGSFVYSPTNGTALNTGTNPLTVVFTPSDTVDYTGVTNNVSVVVQPALLTVTAASTNRVYGQTNPIFTGTIVGVTNSDNITATYSSSATSASAAGTYSITPSLVDPANRQTNYTVNLVNGTLTVFGNATTTALTSTTPVIYGCPLSLIASVSPAPPDGETVVFYAGTIPFMTNTTVGGLAHLTFSSLPVGSYSITASYTGDATRAPSTSAAVSQTVTPATLAVVASNTNSVTGEPLPTFSYSFVGLVNGDTAAALTGEPVLSTPATNSSLPGLYPITVSVTSLSAANYTFSPVNGLLDITASGSVFIGIVNNGDGTVTIGFQGIPNATYIVQTSTSLTSAWLNLSTNVAAANGTFSNTNVITVPARYFRAIQP